MSINFKKLRTQMVEKQLLKRGIEDKLVLDAFRKLPREKFISDKNKKYAYHDGAQLIAAGQTISQPYIVAVMLENLEIKKSDKILEIGTGSGYAAALLAEIAAEVYTIERIEELALKAEKLFNKLNYQNLKVKLGDGSLGWEEHAPYDSILVSAAAPYVPEKLIEQLAKGGTIVIPVGKRNRVQQLKQLKKSYSGKVREKKLDYVRFVPLIGENSWR